MGGDLPGSQSVWVGCGGAHRTRKFIAGPVAEHADWASAEVRRNDVTGIVQAGVAIGRYDARPWASSLGVPAASLVTTRDRLVPPRKQRALAEALRAHVVEVHDDHLCAVTSPVEFSRVTSELVQHVLHT